MSGALATLAAVHRPNLPAVVLAAIVGFAACAAPEGSSSEPTILSATAARDGVVVRLALERRVTAPGEPVALEVSVHLEGVHSVLWRAGACDLAGSIKVQPSARLAPAEAGDGGAAVGDVVSRVRSLVGAVDEPAPVTTRQPDPIARLSSCRVDHGFSELRLGQRLVQRANWSATTVIGSPAAPGSYVVAAEFPLLRPDIELVPADFRAARDLRPIRIELPLLVETRGPSPLTAGQALERMLADPALATWVAAQPRDSLTAGLNYYEGRWLLELATPRGGARAEIGSQGLGGVTLRIGGPKLP